jgi:RNA-directed DNA polymerase
MRRCGDAASGATGVIHWLNFSPVRTAMPTRGGECALPTTHLLIMRVSNHISAEAARLVARHERTMKLAHSEWVRRSRRSATPVTRLVVSEPSWWSADPGFDPYHVRRRAEVIGHATWQRLRDGTYEPRPPVAVSIPKDSGGERQISIFQVADSALSRMAFESILRKNTPMLSGRAYAYRKDMTAQDAVQYVQSEWRGKRRIFVAEFDFSSYFASLSHDHLLEMIESRSMMLTPVEKTIMKGFMRSQAVPLPSYDPSSAARAQRGIPQGTSISLVMANLAASRLDRRLESLGVGFVRYADDTLIWSDSYNAICAAADVLGDEGDRMGVDLNRKKSEGISLLVPRSWERDGEIRTKRSVQFLGYRLGIDFCDIAASGERRIRRRCHDLIFDNLLREPLANNQDLRRLKDEIDRDYVAALNGIRAYLYGALSESKVKQFQRGAAPFIHFEGVMASYPLLNDSDVLRRLDGWILHAVSAAMTKRGHLLVESGAIKREDLPPPHGLTPDELLRLGKPTSTTSGRPVDVSVPSVRRISSVITRSARVFGGGAVGSDPMTGLSNPA